MKSKSNQFKFLLGFLNTRIVLRRACFVSLFFVLSSLPAHAQDADAILKKSEAYRGLNDSFSMQVKIDNFVDKELKETTAFLVLVKDNTTSIAEQIQPSTARGRKLLMKDNDMWLHTPDIKKAIRISLEQKLTGETANGDIAKTNFYGDYAPTVLETTAQHIKLQLDSKVKGTTYKQIIYYVHPKTFVPLRAEFLAASGKLLKTATYGKLAKFGSAQLITVVEITDAMQKKRISRLSYSKFKKEKFDDAQFDRSAL